MTDIERQISASLPSRPSYGVLQSYKPERVLVTGGAGFIASHIVVRLVRKYPHIHVVCVDKLDYCSSLSNLDTVKDKPNFKFIKGNLTSPDLVSYILETEKIDTIIHAAAQTHVDNSFGNSFSFTENNVLGTHVLVEAAKQQGIKRFIHVSTDEVYGSSYAEEASHCENDALEPTNPYAATKAAAESIARSYWFSFKFPVIVTRGNNVYGPHQYPEKIIPKFVRRLVNGKSCCIHGSGQNYRHYIYVEDVAAAFDTIMHNGVDGEIYNIGCDDEFTNMHVATKLIEAIHPECKDVTEHIEYVKDRPFNDTRYYINSTKLHSLGWKPEVDFESGLRRTIEWYKAVDLDWWPVGTDSALAPHPTASSAALQS